ncbi:MAG: 2Fe-2S iron-sulfur cluster-binding protein [Pseudomonadota bacterium]
MRASSNGHPGTAKIEETSLEVDLYRGDKQSGGLVTYTIARQPSQTVLDVVTAIQREQAPGLAYRFSCRVGMCGSCAMTVNGKPRWTCRTHVDKVAAANRLVVEPLSNLPHIRDLVVDLSTFFDKQQQALGRFMGASEPETDFSSIKPDEAQRQNADAGIECIGCAVCYAACDVVAWQPGYLGPAALNRAWTLQNDRRDTARPARLEAIAQAGGCTTCHSMGSCAAACPKQLNPTASIAGLKRAVTRRRFGLPS